MELPLGGPALRHYTQSRPRPHRQKLNYRPSRPQETIIESENEVLELMGRVDEGVEEFFTKRVLPTDVLKKEDEESITVQEVAPASSIPLPPPTKTLRRKLGDFFTLRKRRGLKSETSQEGRPKKASIADFIRPLREVARAEKEKDRVKEHDKDNEKEKGSSAGESAVKETPPLRGEAVPPRRALREGKSQSLILLSGSAATGTPNARNTAKKQLEGQHSFEHKLHLMLQRIGVSKPPPEETPNQEGEMKKAESEGTIIDSKPEPSASFSKPRTMSASSDTRHQIRPSVSAHESAGKPALPPKPVIKPGPLPTTSSTSGRNTPDNELSLIQETETSMSTTHSPTTITAITSTVLTISNSIPDSTSFTISSSSDETPTNTDSAAAATHSHVTEVDSKASEGSSPTTEQPTAAIPATPTGPSTDTEPPDTDISDPQSLPVTLTLTTLSITMETVSAVSSESSRSTILPNLSTESTLAEINVLSSDSTPAAATAAAAAAAAAAATAGGDTTTGDVTTAVQHTTSTSDLPSDSVTTTYSLSETSNDSSLVTSTSSVTVVSLSVTESTSSSNFSETIKTIVSPDETPLTTISAAPSTSSSPTRSPKATDGMDSISASNISQPDPEISVPSTSSGLTNPTDTTSTATSLTHADTTSTSSPNTGAVSSTQSADSKPAIHDLPVTDDSFGHLSSPAHSTVSPSENNVVQTRSPDQTSSVVPTEQAEEEPEVEQNQQTEVDESKGIVDDGKMNGKTTLTTSDDTRGESVTATDHTMAEPPSGKVSECDTDERAEEGQRSLSHK